MDFNNKTVLGRTGLMAGRLGISSSFGASVEAYEEAFERGCNYFTWGTFIKGRSSQMAEAIKNINAKGQRDNLILAMLSYAHSAFLTEISIKKGLKTLDLDYADLLILGYFSKRPPQRIIDGAHKLLDKGLVRFIGITSHNRKIYSIYSMAAIMLPIAVQKKIFSHICIKRTGPASSLSPQRVGKSCWTLKKWLPMKLLPRLLTVIVLYSPIHRLMFT
jgi:predicted aldo/keto reductase-like oxidoreductase